MLLVPIDEYSRNPEIEILPSTSANTVTPKLDRLLSTHGIPTKLKQTTVLLSKVTHSLSLHSARVFVTAKSPLRGQKLIRSQNVSCFKLCVLLTWKTKIGNRNCFFFCETTAPHLIPTLESPLLSYFLDVNSLSNCLNSSTRRRPVH